MTPRSIDNQNEREVGVLSDSLFKQSELGPNLDLRLDSEVFKIEHPTLIKTKVFWNLAPDKLNFHPSDKYFFDLSPRADVESGKPFLIHRFLSKKEDVQFNLPWSGVHLTAKPLLKPSTPGLNHYLTQNWLNYALSPELWGVNGKWSRFDHELCELFQKYKLLEERPEIGFYRLNSKVKLIEKYGFRGDDLGNNYQIILPWDFSLSSLNKLKEIIIQEF
jgi:hypothetical protein